MTYFQITLEMLSKTSHNILSTCFLTMMLSKDFQKDYSWQTLVNNVCSLFTHTSYIHHSCYDFWFKNQSTTYILNHELHWHMNETLKTCKPWKTFKYSFVKTILKFFFLQILPYLDVDHRCTGYALKWFKWQQTIEQQDDVRLATTLGNCHRGSVYLTQKHSTM
jgi:hypothetical protein